MVNWDHGAGIKYWKDRYNGKLKYIPLEYVEKGHFSPTSHPELFKRQKHHIGRDLKQQLDSQVGVAAACKLMNIDYLKRAICEESITRIHKLDELADCFSRDNTTKEGKKKGNRKSNIRTRHSYVEWFLYLGL